MSARNAPGALIVLSPLFAALMSDHRDARPLTKGCPGTRYRGTATPQRDGRFRFPETARSLGAGEGGVKNKSGHRNHIVQGSGPNHGMSDGAREDLHRGPSGESHPRELSHA